MPTINLRDYYPSVYKADCFLEVSDEISGAMAEIEREEHAYYERRRYHKAYYSLNAGDGIERAAIRSAASPENTFFDDYTREQLDAALATLTEAQRRRVELHVVCGISKADIAAAEGISEKNIRQSISRALLNMEKYLKNIF